MRAAIAFEGVTACGVTACGVTACGVRRQQRED
jgi:hypothetical protein